MTGFTVRIGGFSTAVDPKDAVLCKGLNCHNCVFTPRRMGDIEALMKRGIITDEALTLFFEALGAKNKVMQNPEERQMIRKVAEELECDEMVAKVEEFMMESQVSVASLIEWKQGSIERYARHFSVSLPQIWNNQAMRKEFLDGGFAKSFETFKRFVKMARQNNEAAVKMMSEMIDTGALELACLLCQIVDWDSVSPATAGAFCARLRETARPNVAIDCGLEMLEMVMKVVDEKRKFTFDDLRNAVESEQKKKESVNNKLAEFDAVVASMATSQS